MVTGTTRPRPTMEPNDHEESGRHTLTPVSLFIVLVIVSVIFKMGTLTISVLMAVLLGTVLEGPVRRFQQRGFPRPAAIAVCYVGVIAAIVALVLVILPVVRSEADDFRENVPGQLHSLQETWADSGNALLSGPGVSAIQSALNFVENPADTGTTVSTDAVSSAIPIIGTVVGGLATTITTLVVTFYYLLEKRLIRQVVLDQLRPGARERVDHVWTDVETKVGGWLRGQLLLCLIIGSIATVSYGLIGVNFWPLLGLWAGVTEIIPIIGPWIGGIPAVLVALTQGWQTALMVGLIIVLMQTLENWFLVPRVMRGAVGLTPLTVFVAILAGTELAGPIGAVLAIPIAAGIQVIITDLIDRRRAASSYEGMHTSSWRWMLNRAMDRDGSRVPAATIDLDTGTQIVSEEIDTDDDEAPAFDEAPKIIADDENEDAKAAASESTWPANPWRAQVTRRGAGSASPSSEQRPRPNRDRRS